VARIYVDEDLSPRLAARLRERGHDAVATQDAGRKGASDDDQLLFAAQQRRTLVALNGRDFVLLHDAWLRWSAAWQVSHETGIHAGILVLEPALVGDLTDTVDAHLASSPLLTNQMHRRVRGVWQVRRLGAWTARE